MNRILIVEPFAPLREALRGTLERAGFEILGVLTDANEAESACEKLRPELLLMNAECEAFSSGIDAARKICAKSAAPKVVLAASHFEISYAFRAKHLGAAGFYLYPDGLSGLAAFLRRANAGDGVFADRKGFPAPAGQAEFTAREKEVLRRICLGESTAQIAAALYISENTVKFHKKNMLLKTGFSTCAQLGAYMMARGYCCPLY